MTGAALSFFAVVVMEIPGAQLDDATFERSIKELHGNKRIIEMTSINVIGGLGREIVTANERDEMDHLRLRIIVLRGRHYDVGVATSNADAMRSAATERFFRSFTPLK